MAKRMSKRKKQKLIKGVITAICIIVLAVMWLLRPSTDNGGSFEIPSGRAEVHFIDVGQGDSTLIMVGDECMLIDTGDKSAKEELTSYLDEQGIKEIDYFVITHFDSDHYGVATHVLNTYKVNNVLMPNQVKTGVTYETFIDTLEEKKNANELNVLNAHDMIGKTITLGAVEAKTDANGVETQKASEGMVFTVLAPLSDEYEDSNDYSVVMMARYGNKKVLLTGDAEKESEAEIVEQYNQNDLDCDILKVGHHGSKTSSSQRFLDKARPEIAVISCGEGNRYAHPHAEALERLRDIPEIVIYRTDENGSIAFVIENDIITKK